MQANQAQVLTHPPARPVTWKGNEEAAGTSSRVTADLCDPRTEDERLLDEELQKLLDECTSEEDEEIERLLNEYAPEEDEEIAKLINECTQEEDEELAKLLDECTSEEADVLAATPTDGPTPEREEEPLAARTAEPAPVRATFEPTTKMDAGRVKWGRTRFVAIPHALLTHGGFAELSGRASKLLLAMLTQYAGSNNGHLTATHSRMKRFGFNSKDSLAKSIQELIAFGYIVRTRSQQRRLPARYALTWLPINKALAGEPYDRGIEPGAEALDLWRDVEPSKAKATLLARTAPAAPIHVTGAFY